MLSLLMSMCKPTKTPSVSNLRCRWRPMGKAEQTLRMRVKLVTPPLGVMFALQEGQGGRVSPVTSDGSALAFDFTLKVTDLNSVPVRFTGPFAQGPASARFVYVCSGVRAGQAGSCWNRRVKIPLTGLSAELVIAAIDCNATVEGTISGIAKDGGPACASVKLLNDWSLA